MRPRLEALIRTTTFRLALVQAGVVLSFVVALLAYVYIATAGQLIRDSDQAVDQEYLSLERAYAEGGMRRLNQEIIERAARQGPMLYVLANADGAVVAGDFQHLGRLPGETPERTDFSFDRIDDAGTVTRGRARGRLGRLLNGPILMVARDLGDSAVIAGRITRVLWTVAILGLVLSVVSGLLASWQAARRAEALSTTARDVMAGDLSRRAPARAEGDEFDELAADINAMLDRLEQLVQTTRTAGDAIAHDLRSPLTRFRQKLEAALEAPPDTDNDREALRMALAEADNVLDMFAKVLRVARVESASNWRFEPVDVTDVARELAEFYQPAAEEVGLAFSSKVDNALAVRGDRGLVTQALSNLIENAMKYTPSGGRIEVRAERRRDGRVELCVLDNGPGVPPTDRERVMQRFVRLETARSTPGVGLGLSLVSAVARLHKGELQLRDGLAGAGVPGLAAALILPATEPQQRPLF
ncbi:MAG TPA: HAMP domain-containing sensor histidine kinase [Caulobacterales bacterium]|nr:HAMP domain-containing sensor histidine kinase [Caulobacterales bacterium]